MMGAHADRGWKRAVSRRLSGLEGWADLIRWRGGERHGPVLKLGMRKASYHQRMEASIGSRARSQYFQDKVITAKGNVTEELQDKLWKWAAWVQILALPLTDT